MNLNKDYYKILSVSGDADEKTIKKSYYKLSFEYHPDRNKEVDITKFNSITEAYDVLCSELRKEYDLKSKFGANYNEYYELFDINIDYDHKKSESRLKKFKDDEVLNIKITVDDSFDGNLEYQRWVKCKTCSGTGKDLSSKIVIKDNDGNIVKTFDSDDGCDFCEGTGKDYTGNGCYFCQGAGKVGLTLCKSCNGEKRILGKQKLTNIKLESDELKLEAMGHHSKREVGKSGYLLIKLTT
jgi:DnaJ-class molecular chaperone